MLQDVPDAADELLRIVVVDVQRQPQEPAVVRARPLDDRRGLPVSGGRDQHDERRLGPLQAREKAGSRDQAGRERGRRVQVTTERRRPIRSRDVADQRQLGHCLVGRSVIGRNLDTRSRPSQSTPWAPRARTCVCPEARTTAKRVHGRK